MHCQKKFMHAYILKENKNKSKKNHTFIKCIFEKKKSKIL